MTTTMFLPEVDPVRHASRQLVRQLGFLDNRQRAFGITHSQCHALIELGLRGELTAGELSSLLQLDKSTMSRTLADLQKGGLIGSRAVQDRRKRPLALTAKGKKKLDAIHESANHEVHAALSLLDDGQRRQVVAGMSLYAKALGQARSARGLTIRAIKSSDDPNMARIIRSVMTEYGASGAGFAIHDAEVDAMSEAYKKKARYFVIARGDQVLGGGGFAQLKGGDAKVCELRKMYFLPELRGLGLGRRLLLQILGAAREAGYETCYLETLKSMVQARALYESVGFKPGKKPLGDTGHFGCDAWYTKKLTD